MDRPRIDRPSHEVGDARREAVFARELGERVFVSHHDPSDDVRAVRIEALDPFLRSLLFTDGTVIRALEVRTLRKVAVDVIDHASVPAPPKAASRLAIKEGQEAVRRRVAIRIGPLTAPAVCAESYIVAERVPEAFRVALAGNPAGIGGSLDAVGLPTSRELLWFGLGSAASWGPMTGTEAVLIRLYRIITRDRPAILIQEEFTVESTSGVYRLVGLRNDEAR